MNAKRRGLSLMFAGAGLASLLAGALADVLFPRIGWLPMLAGIVGYLAFGGRATSLWPVRTKSVDREDPLPHRPTPPPGIAAAVGLVLLATAAPAPSFAQQTIFNVPSADVLDTGKVYLEIDELFRPADPKFSSTTVRGVVGVVPRVEAGVNLGGLNAPGPAIPTATVAVKIQPVRAGGFRLIAGGYGLFFLEGSEDGNPAGLGYGFASYTLPKLRTRIDIGGWYSSAGYAHSRSTGGALATFEQPLPFVEGLTLAADWWSGENSIGYVSPGLIYTTGHWTAYAAFTIKNGDPRGNGGLIELGYVF